MLKIQRPEKTSRTSSKPPSTDRKEQRERSRPGGAKPGHDGHSRAMAEDFDRVIDHRPCQCACCGTALASDLAASIVSEHETIELPEIKPLVERHRRLAVSCPSCGMLVAAPVPDVARGTPFGPRLHAVATYLKTFQALSYERLQGAFADLFGLAISQGGLMNILRRAQGAFVAERDDAIAALRRARVVASDETGVRIEGSNAYQWVFRSADAVVHQAAPTRGAIVVKTLMDCSATYVERPRGQGLFSNEDPSLDGAVICTAFSCGGHPLALMKSAKQVAGSIRRAFRALSHRACLASGCRPAGSSSFYAPRRWPALSAGQFVGAVRVTRLPPVLFR